MHEMFFSTTIHAKGLFGTDARNQKDHFDGCTQRTFGQRMRKVWGKSQMRATYIPDARNPFNREFPSL